MISDLNTVIPIFRIYQQPINIEVILNSSLYTRSLNLRTCTKIEYGNDFARKQQTISLEKCLNSFGMNEILDEDN